MVLENTQKFAVTNARKNAFQKLAIVVLASGKVLLKPLCPNIEILITFRLQYMHWMKKKTHQRLNKKKTNWTCTIPIQITSRLILVVVFYQDRCYAPL